MLGATQGRCQRSRVTVSFTLVLQGPYLLHHKEIDLQSQSFG